jgi:(2Fe-2S) ferredoxin
MGSGIDKQRKEVIERIIQEHLIGIMMVEEYAFLSHHDAKNFPGLT